METEKNTSDTHTSHARMEEIMEQNRELLEENNKLLKKIHRGNIIQLWTRIAWYLVIIGVPFAMYFLVKDYFAALGADYEIFKAGMQEIPGFKNINNW